MFSINTLNKLEGLSDFESFLQKKMLTYGLVALFFELEVRERLRFQMIN